MPRKTSAWHFSGSGQSTFTLAIEFARKHAREMKLAATLSPASSGPCAALAEKVGWRGGPGEEGTCRLEIAMRGRSVASMLLSMPDNAACGEAGERDSFLLVAPPSRGPPGHAIYDDEVWSTT